MVLLEAFDQRHQLRRVVRRALIGGERRLVLGLQRFGALCLDGCDDVGEFRIALAGLQQRAGRNGDARRAVIGAFQRLQLAHQRHELRAGRVDLRQRKGRCIGRGDRLQRGDEIDILALEVVIAGDLVGIDAATDRVGGIGGDGGRQRHVEAHQLLLACGHVAGVVIVGGALDGVVGGIEADTIGARQHGEHGIRLRRHAATIDPDEAGMAGIEGLDGLGDLGRGLDVDVAHVAAGVGERRALHRRHVMAVERAGDDGIGEIGSVDAAQRLGLVGVIARAGDLLDRRGSGLRLLGHLTAGDTRKTRVGGLGRRLLAHPRATAANDIHQRDGRCGPDIDSHKGTARQEGEKRRGLLQSHQS